MSAGGGFAAAMAQSQADADDLAAGDDTDNMVADSEAKGGTGAASGPAAKPAPPAPPALPSAAPAAAAGPAGPGPAAGRLTVEESRSQGAVSGAVIWVRVPGGDPVCLREPSAGWQGPAGRAGNAGQ